MRIKHIVTGIIIFSMAYSSSCKKFLSVTPRNEKIVSTVEDYRDILASYMVFIKTPNPEYKLANGIFGKGYFYPNFDLSGILSVYSGECLISKSDMYLDKSSSLSTSLGKSINSWTYTNWTTWQSYYQFLGPVNLIIMGIEDAQGDETVRDYVKGEALLWRAYAYFKLLQYYSPYTDNELGIPVNLDPVTDIGVVKPVRNTQSEVYAQIIGDGESALKLLERTPGESWNFLYNQPYVYSFLAAVYHYKALSGAGEESDWRNAEIYAGKAMQGRALVNTAARLKDIFDASSTGIANFTNLKSDAFFVRIMDGPNGFIFNYAYNLRSPTDGSVNPAWLNFYKQEDIRKQVYFSEDGSTNTKYNLQSLSGAMGYGLLMPFRLAEMYLIKSEALLRQGKTEESRTILAQFKSARYTLPQTVSSNAAILLADILDERNREFYLENDFVWLDFKRLGKSLSRIVDGEEYKLSPDDYRYSFPVPATELLANRALMQNPGWDQFIK